MKSPCLVRIGRFLFHYRNGLFPVIYLLLFVPGHRRLENNSLALGLGLAVALAGQFLRAVTIGLKYIVRGGKNRQIYARKLVTEGLFAHSRNPLYLGNFLILLGLGIAADSLIFLTVGTGFFLFAYLAIVAAEEQFLREKFGAEFDEYCERVNRFLPTCRGLDQTVRGMRFDWRRLVSAEYGSTFVWAEAFLLATIQNFHETRARTPADPSMIVLWALAAAVFAAYLGARILKKTGRLESGTPTG